MSTKRQACVIIDQYLTTEYFDLERGNAQGDTISPFLFNLGYQLLMFKLELSLQIKGVLSEFEKLAKETLPSDSPHRTEVSPCDPKAFSLADDCTLLLEMTVSNIRNVILTLKNFENI